MPSRRFPFLHPWDRERPFRQKLDRDVRQVMQEARARARCYPDSSYAQTLKRNKRESNA